MSSSLGKQLWWCKTCNVPLLKDRCEICENIGVKICSDLKPMFEDECKLLEKETGREMPGLGWQGYFQ
jgi:predicted RNA-binding protein with PUA domain